MFNDNMQLIEAAEMGVRQKIKEANELLSQIMTAKLRLQGGQAVVVPAAASDPQHAPTKGRKKRTLSPEARQKIAAAQKKRWKAHRKEQEQQQLQ